MVSRLDVEDLLETLTLEEKNQLLAGADFWHTLPIKRLGIPSIRMSDGPNGVRGTRFFNGAESNCFPCGTALASSFDVELLEEVGALMGQEARKKGAHIILGPTCNIVRSPLGGRSFESYSEDPVLSGLAAASIINGIQGKDKILACIKHYVCNDQEDERKAVDTIITERALREIYLKPFQIALRDSNPRTLMTAYNKVNGVHVSQSPELLRNILRDEWKYDGAVMSDWFGTYSIKKSLEAGLNLEMPGPTRFRQEIPLAHKVNSNEVHIDTINENVARVLTMVNEALKTGIPENAPEHSNNAKEVSELLRRVATESMVLLKNEGKILPLSKTNSGAKNTYGMIGPNSKAGQESGGGSAALNPSYVISPWEGFRNKLAAAGNQISLRFAQGASLDRNLPDIGKLLQTEDGEPGFMAKFYHDEPGSACRDLFETLTLRSSKVFLSDFKSDGLKPGQILYYIDFEGYYVPEESGTYEIGCSCLGTAQIFIDGKLVVDNKTNQTPGNSFFLGMGTDEVKANIQLNQGVKYKIKVEFGTSPTSKIASLFIETGGVYFGARLKTTPKTMISQAVELAKQVDTVILCIGLTKEWESEGFDRPTMQIPGYTNQLVLAVVAANPNTVVLNQSGSPVDMSSWIDQVPAVLQAWYGGNELGNAIADIVFGDSNPSGKLSMSFPAKLEDTPSFVNFGSTNGRVLYGEDVFVGYRFYEITKTPVLFPFGHGLSYSSFQHSNLTISITNDDLCASVQLHNSSDFDGCEVTQLYVSHQSPAIIRPRKELKAFAKTFVPANQSKTVNLKVSLREATSYWDSYQGKWCSEKGQYCALVAASSSGPFLSQSFSIDKPRHWLGL